MRYAGFTLLELILSIAIMGVLALMMAPVYQAFQNRNELDVAAMEIAQDLRRAQTLASGSDGDATWGVFVQAGSVTLFKGSSYSTRDTAYDETFTISSTITVSGTTEYVFAKMTGDPSVAGTTTLTSLNNETRSISLSTKGLVSY